MRTGLHLMGVERKGIPDWVIEHFHPPVIDVPTLNPKQPWRLQIVPPWHPQVEKAFMDFLAAFNQTGIARREEVVYAYIAIAFVRCVACKCGRTSRWWPPIRSNSIPS